MTNKQSSQNQAGFIYSPCVIIYSDASLRFFFSFLFFWSETLELKITFIKRKKERKNAQRFPRLFRTLILLKKEKKKGLLVK